MRPAQTQPTPWGPGCAVSAMVAALTATAVYAFGVALTVVHPAVAVVVNVVAVAGIAPSAWRWRCVPVIRWVLAGVAVGVAVAWMALLV